MQWQTLWFLDDVSVEIICDFAKHDNIQIPGDIQQDKKQYVRESVVYGNLLKVKPALNT